ncbi:hypothetical protein IWW36_002411 [Coemansia brasiliensis]|uniref:Major facilitator superfamily (MFS) profile domain-containing protein n=1 Tax=Coemansia brasiliensis TaxID=2650707 RepID=A0A9W8IC21_9FUNG|nr:hypothetical protein IWW36_002411 [Coemansia brasiliensis]
MTHTTRTIEPEDTQADSADRMSCASIDSNDTNNEQIRAKETPLPWDKLSVLLAVRLSEPINATMILPFVYQMVADFKVAKSPKDIAFYASLLFASFSVCQTMTVMYWGRLSDRIGRRPVLMIGLTGYLISFLMFGVSRSFAWALTARCLNGLLAGNVAVIKSVFAEISDDTNRARMMALLPLMWNIGSVGGAAIGGIFADPVHQYPNVFGNVRMFQVFPYLLPCLIGCSITVFGLVMGIFKLEETLVREPAVQKPLPSTSTSSSSLATEATALLSSGEATKQRTVWDLLTPTVIRVMATNVVMCLAVAMCDQAYPIFAASDSSDGGLGFASRGIGISMAISSVAVLYLQLVAYSRLERKHGALWCYRKGQIILIPFYLTIPFLSMLASRLEASINSQGILSMPSTWVPLSMNELFLWVLLIILLLARTTGNVLAFTSINLLTVNLAPSKSDLGFMNGAQQLAMSATRIIGPVLAGSVWSWSIKHNFLYPFNSHMVWVLCATLTWLSLKLTYKIPESANVFAAGKSKTQNAEEV